MSASRLPVPLGPEPALEALLEREASDLRALIELLEEELDALAGGTAGEVEACARAKQQLIRQIFAARDAVNAAARGQPGFAAGGTAEAWLARHGSPRIRQAFERLTDLAGVARELNQLASRVVHHKLAGINDRLDILLPPGRTSTLYASGGTVESGLLAKSIIGRA